MKEYQPKNSYTVQDSRVEKFANMLESDGWRMDIEDIKQIEKETLFDSKKNL